MRATIRDVDIIIPEAIDDYRFSSFIESDGPFSKVAIFKHYISQQLYAVKIIPKAFFPNNESIKTYEEEVTNLQNLDHPNIIKIYNFLSNETLVFVVMEFCQHGSIKDFMIKHQKMSEAAARVLFIQLLNVIVFFHSHNMSHRDLRPENILLDSQFNIRVADLGFATINHLSIDNTFYASPEELADLIIDGEKSDAWAVGIVLCWLTTGSLPWKADDRLEVLERLSLGQCKLRNCLSEAIQDLIMSLLNPDPGKRMSIDEALEHRWTQNKFSTLKPKTFSIIVQKPNITETISLRTLSDRNLPAKPVIKVPEVEPSFSLTNTIVQKRPVISNRKPLGRRLSLIY